MFSEARMRGCYMRDPEPRVAGPTTLRVHLALGGIAVYTIRDNKVWEPNEEIWIPLPEYIQELADNSLDAHSDVCGFEVR